MTSVNGEAERELGAADRAHSGVAAAALQPSLFVPVAPLGRHHPAAQLLHAATDGQPFGTAVPALEAELARYEEALERVDDATAEAARS